jgi:hypothetical protein
MRRENKSRGIHAIVACVKVKSYYFFGKELRIHTVKLNVKEVF